MKTLPLASLTLVVSLVVAGCTSNKPSSPSIEEIERIIKQDQQRQEEYDRKMAEYQACLDNTFNRIRNGELIFGVSGSTQSVYDYCAKYRP